MRNFNENITRIARLVYDFKNLKTESAIVPLNLGTPNVRMRGPGDCTGDFAIESAIDELSYKLKEDPIALRLKNIALKNDPESGKPWSTHFIDECLEKGAAVINWKNRKASPGQTTEGDWKIGYRDGRRHVDIRQGYSQRCNCNGAKRYDYRPDCHDRHRNRYRHSDAKSCAAKYRSAEE
jgi:hypothetical protein